MITTGQPSSSPTTKTTEVVDVVNGETCADLADFPLGIRAPVGANLHGTPVVCGGQEYPTYLQACYKYSNTGWQRLWML